jgi:hypothetical protein
MGFYFTFGKKQKISFLFRDKRQNMVTSLHAYVQEHTDI